MLYIYTNDWDEAVYCWRPVFLYGRNSIVWWSESDRLTRRPKAAKLIRIYMLKHFFSITRFISLTHSEASNHY
jgi:hypothetical protein